MHCVNTSAAVPYACSFCYNYTLYLKSQLSPASSFLSPSITHTYTFLISELISFIKPQHTKDNSKADCSSSYFVNLITKVPGEHACHQSECRTVIVVVNTVGLNWNCTACKRGIKETKNILSLFSFLSVNFHIGDMTSWK